MPTPPLKAIVTGGRAIIEDVGDYPDGTELELEIVANDEMNEEERAKLNASIERGLSQMGAGNTMPVEDLIDSLRARGRRTIEAEARRYSATTAPAPSRCVHRSPDIARIARTAPGLCRLPLRRFAPPWL